MNSLDKPNESTVVLLQCVNYDEQRVMDTVKQGIALLGGAECFVKTGERILLKPNMLVAKAPETRGNDASGSVSGLLPRYFRKRAAY